MSNEKILQQLETDQAAEGEKRARYTAYMQRIRKLERRKAEHGTVEKTESSVNGGTAL